MEEVKDILQHALADNGFHFSESIQDKFLAYLNLLHQWNRVFNLTAIREPREMVYLHLLDSLSIHSYLQGSNIIDVGTGAGLPGIPLAIINPDKQFVLLDSNSKKTRFLIQVVSELKLKNVTIVHERAEDFKTEKCFDTILSRALASIKDMLTNTQHLVCPHGIFLAMKGVYPEDEIADISEDFKIEKVYKLEIKGLAAERCVVCIKVK